MVLLVFIVAIFCLRNTTAFKCGLYVYGNGVQLDANKALIGNYTFDYLKTTDNVDNEYILSFIFANGGCHTYGNELLVTLATCPVGADAEIAAACQDPASDLPPVWYTREPIWMLFANGYCALCRQVRDNLVPWTPEVNCINRTEAAPNVDIVNDKSCSLEFSPGVVYNKQLECPPTLLNFGRCDNFASPLQCSFRDFQESLKVACKGGDTEIVPGSSLSVLFDQPKFKSMALAKINGKLFKGSDLCNPDETFDSLFQKCRQIICPIGFKAKFGECHQNTTVYVQPASLPFANGTNSVTCNLNMIMTNVRFASSMNLIVSQFKNLTSIDVTVVGKPQFLRSTLRVNIADIIFEQLFNILGQILIRSVELNISIFNFKDETEVTDACGIEAYRCFQNPYTIYQKGSLFAKVNISDFEFFFQVEHMFFNLSMSNNKQTDIRLIEVCVCETTFAPYFRSNSSSFSQNCSFIWYRYAPDEYVILDNNVLEIVDTNLRFTPSEYQIEKNSTALICYDPSKQLDSFLDMDPVQTYISWAFSGTSILFLILTITLNIKFKEIRKLPAKLTTCLAISLACGQSLLILPKIGRDMCRYAAALTHFSWLSAFMWMSAQAIQMLLTFHPATLRVSSEREGQNMFRKYCIICLSIPLLIVVPSFILEVVPGDHVRLGYGVTSCGWISNMDGSIVTFFVPVGATLIINMVCFGLTLFYIQKAIAGLAKVKGKTSDRNMCLIYLKLSSVLGFSWIFGFIAAFAKIQALWYIYIVLNGLQGVFVFLSFTINMTKRRTRKSINNSTVRSSTAGT